MQRAPRFVTAGKMYNTEIFCLITPILMLTIQIVEHAESGQQLNSLIMKLFV
jgi:hypothetical protein